MLKDKYKSIILKIQHDAYIPCHITSEYYKPYILIGPLLSQMISAFSGGQKETLLLFNTTWPLYNNNSNIILINSRLFK